MPESRRPSSIDIIHFIDSLLVEIAHNPILVNIEWNLKTIDVKGKPYKVLFYNNSMLNIDPAMTAILKANATKESYVDELGGE